MRIGFTGTQQGMSRRQAEALEALLRDAKGSEFHHGDCIGADADADAIARRHGYRIVIHPPINPAKRAFCPRRGDLTREPDEYLVRNQHIVDATDLLIASPKSEREELRSGTWSTVRYARRTGRPVTILNP